MVKRDVGHFRGIKNDRLQVSRVDPDTHAPADSGRRGWRSGAGIRADPASCREPE